MTLAPPAAPPRIARQSAPRESPSRLRPGRPELRGSVAPTFSLYAGNAHDLMSAPAGLVVTPNLDHLRLLDGSRSLRRAYAQADVVLNDSRFLDRLALRGAALCLPGSELAPAILDRLAGGSRVYVLGCDATVQSHLMGAYPGLDFVFTEPSMGYIKRRGERRALVAAVLQARPDCVFICTGAPQSELLAAQLKRAGCTATILCCGSAFHFLSGAKRRAPERLQRVGAEWLWRFVCEARTRKRYAADALFLARNLGVMLALRRKGIGRFAGFVLSVG